MAKLTAEEKEEIAGSIFCCSICSERDQERLIGHIEALEAELAQVRVKSEERLAVLRQRHEWEWEDCPFCDKLAADGHEDSCRYTRALSDDTPHDHSWALKVSVGSSVMVNVAERRVTTAAKKDIFCTVCGITADRE